MKGVFIKEERPEETLFREFLQVIDMRDKLPALLLGALDGLFWLSLYNVEIGGKARFLGMYF